MSRLEKGLSKLEKGVKTKYNRYGIFNIYKKNNMFILNHYQEIIKSLKRYTNLKIMFMRNMNARNMCF